MSLSREELALCHCRSTGTIEIYEDGCYHVVSVKVDSKYEIQDVIESNDCIVEF